MPNLIKRIYEIQDTGKGLINSITEDNLLLIFELTQNLQGFEDVLVHNSNLTFGHIINSAQNFNITTNIADFIIDQLSANDYPDYPLACLGIGRGNLLTESSFAIFDEVMEFRDTRNNKGVSYAGDYEANFVARSLVTKQYVQAQIAAIPAPTGAETKVNAGTGISVTGVGTIASPYVIAATAVAGSSQKILTYPTDFTGTNYTLQASDNDKLIFVDNGATNVTLTIPLGLSDEFFAAFIREGAGDISFATTGGMSLRNAIPGGVYIDRQYDQVALDKRGSAEIYYLTGNVID